MGWLKGCPILLYLMYNNLFDMIGIYLITNHLNGKKYVGQSADIEGRWKEHIIESKCRCECVIHKALKKYGVENFSFEVLEECPVDKLDEKEIYWIDKLDTYKSGYNMTVGGGGNNQGKDSYSKEYNKEYKRKYYQDNKDTIKERHNQYRDEHKEEIMEQVKKYQQDHREEIREYQKRYRLENKDKIREYKRQYRLKKKQG